MKLLNLLAFVIVIVALYVGHIEAKGGSKGGGGGGKGGGSKGSGHGSSHSLKHELVSSFVFEIFQSL